jgi:hypothetical protein
VTGLVRTIISNVVAALGVLVMWLLADAIDVLIHPILQPKCLWVFLAAAFAFFCLANRGLLRRRPAATRFGAVALLSALLAAVTFVPAIVVTRILHYRIKSIPMKVSGRVTDLSGRPIGGARVVVTPFGDPELQHRPREVEAVSDTDGRFAARTVHGCNEVSARADGYAIMSFVREARFGSNRHWDFELPEAVSVSGRVLDTNGNPLAGLLVRLSPMTPRSQSVYQPRFGEGYPPTPTDEEGRFTLTTAAPTLHEISVTSTNLSMRQYPVNGCCLDLRSGASPEPPDIILNPPADYAISGVVRDEEGHPIPEVFVDTYTPTGARWYDRTDAQGAFCLEGLDGVGVSVFTVNFQGSHKGRRFDAAIHGVPMHETNANLVVPGRSADAKPLLTLEPPATNAPAHPTAQAIGSGKVRVSVAYPDIYFYCEVRLTVDPPPESWFFGEQARAEDGVFGRSYVLQSGGAYCLSNVPPGRWNLSVAMNNHRSTPLWTRVVELKDREHLAFDVDLTPLVEEELRR